MWQKCLLFQLSHCVYIHFTCLFIWCWTFRLIPLFGYMEEYCYKHECTSISLKWYFQLLEYVPRSAIADSLGTPIFRKTYDMFFFLNPTATVRFYVHTNITQGLQFLFILTNAFFVVCNCFNGCEAILIRVYFPVTGDVEHIPSSWL